MNHPLVALALVILVGVSLVAYLFGFATGKSQGLDEGHEKGKKEGKKEGSIRAFAVGYDRGKREDQQPSSEDVGPSKPSWSILFLLVVVTVVALTIATALVNRR